MGSPARVIVGKLERLVQECSDCRVSTGEGKKGGREERWGREGGEEGGCRER